MNISLAQCNSVCSFHVLMVMSVSFVHEQKPGYWYQQQLIPGVRLPAGDLMPNTFVPQLNPGMRQGAGRSMPNSLGKVQHVSSFNICIYKHDIHGQYYPLNGVLTCVTKDNEC